MRPINLSPAAFFSRKGQGAFQWVRQDMQADTISGLTVAVMGVPQAMAYAMIAGVPPIYGLYTSIVSCIIGAAFGSSNHLVSGPTNASSWLLFSITAPYIGVHDPVEVILLLTVLTGLVKLIFGLLKMGGVVRYVSNSVVVGLTAGAGILIAGNQIKNILDISLDPTKTRQFYQVIIESVKHLGETNYYSLAVGIFTALVVVFAKKIHRKLPGPLLGVILSTLFVYLFKWYEGDKGVSILRDLSDEPIRASLAIFHYPELLTPKSFDFGLVKELVGGAIAVAILGLVEASSSSRAVAASSGQKLNFSREFVAQGLSNIGGAFFLNFAGSGSFTRTALCYQSGGRTRMAAIMSAVFTALAVLALGPLANFIPKASLAGMLIVIAYSMIEKNRLRLALKSTGYSRVILFSTLICTLIMPLQYAIFIGVFISIVFLLKVTGKAYLTLLVPRENGRFEQVPHGQPIRDPIMLVNMEGDLYFAAAENLDMELNRVITPNTRVIILRMKRLRAVGSSAMAILAHFQSSLHEKGISLVVCGIQEKLAGVLTNSGLRDRIGEQNIFYADNTLLQSTELALARARGIVEMQRRRNHHLNKEQAAENSATSRPRLTARELVSRQCIRFGESHSLREAVWLLSEMNRRIQPRDAQPLFLQDHQGKLIGSITPWKLLERMTQDLPSGDLEKMSDTELGAFFLRHFDTILTTFCDKSPSYCHLEDGLGHLLANWTKSRGEVLAVCDAGDRVVGLTTQSDLLRGLATEMGLLQEDKETDEESEAP